MVSWMAKKAGHVAAGRVDVERDVAVGGLRLQVEQLGDDEVGHGVVDGRAEEDDAVRQQAGVDVVGPLAPVGLLDHRRYQTSAPPRSSATVWLHDSGRAIATCNRSRCDSLRAWKDCSSAGPSSSTAPRTSSGGWSPSRTSSASWLGRDVVLDLRPGGRGRLTDDDGTVRHLAIDDVVEGERVAFRWWPEDDERAASRGRVRHRAGPARERVWSSPRRRPPRR